MRRAFFQEPGSRAVAPAFLFTGMAIAVFLFAHAYGRTDGRTAPPAADSAAAPKNDRAAAAAAHESMGVRPGDGAAVIFHEKVQALKRRVAAAPRRRDLVLQLARLLRDGHQGAQAVPYYSRAIAMDSLDAQPYYDLATVYASLGEWSRAADLLQRRLRMRSSDAIALYDLGAVRASQGRRDEARALLERARTATSDDTLRGRISRAIARLDNP